MNQPWCKLDDLAFVGLGYKSLQNQFYYLQNETIDHYKIENDFLKPVIRMKEIRSSHFFQKINSSNHLFICNFSEADLRGTKALRYIRDMAKRPSTLKKQSGAPKTIKEALEAQGSGYWYAPKAKMHFAHIWLRKAFDSTYAPFLFSQAIPFDQRCNYIIPRPKLSWDLLAAIISSSLFAFSVESFGSASMGAGALELPTKKLREVRVVDVRRFEKKEKIHLIELASITWENENPTDWRKCDQPGPFLSELDQFIIDKMGNPVELDTIYKDLVETCRSRLRLSEDKKGKIKKKIEHDIESVAEAIVKRVQPLLDAKRFPDDFFLDTEKSISFDFEAHKNLILKSQLLLGHTSVTISTEEDPNRFLLDIIYTRSVAEIMIRSLLMGRRKFKVPINEDVAKSTLLNFKPWFQTICERIEDSCQHSAIGTRYEIELHNVTMQKLNLHHDIMHTELFGEYNLP